MVICLMGQEMFADKLVGIGILTTKLAVYSGCQINEGNPSVTWGGMVLSLRGVKSRDPRESNPPSWGLLRSARNDSLWPPISEGLHSEVPPTRG